ncbi:MAG: class I SAM-dependent rRNA methyltransferase, partial [Myxococcota bacterium]
ARENFRLNDLNPEAHIFAAADAFRFEPDNPGLLVCDPPALSRSQKSDRSAARAYRDLATQCGRSLSGGGLLATASCTARLSQDRWEDAVRDGLKKAGRWAWLWRAAEPPDHPISSQHPEGRYLKFGLLRKLA